MTRWRLGAPAPLSRQARSGPRGGSRCLCQPNRHLKPSPDSPGISTETRRAALSALAGLVALALPGAIASSDVADAALIDLGALAQCDAQETLCPDNDLEPFEQTGIVATNDRQLSDRGDGAAFGAPLSFVASFATLPQVRASLVCGFLATILTGIRPPAYGEHQDHWEKPLRIVIAIAAGTFALTVAARAVVAGPPEYNRGYNDCLAGRYDEAQNSRSYRQGCHAAEEERGMYGRPSRWRSTVGIPEVNGARTGFDRDGVPRIPERRDFGGRRDDRRLLLQSRDRGMRPARQR